MTLRRLDAHLVKLGLARSREQARELIESGAVEVKGTKATKASRQVELDDSIKIVREGDDPNWVSRGAHKLIGALDTFSTLDVAGKVCLDAGASTGGFTQVLLDADASQVYAVDVGYGQLAWILQTDERVELRDRTNVRNLKAGDFDPAPSLVVADLSFISLTTVLPALVNAASRDADFVLMVKPQFEVGRDRLGKSGVVRSDSLRVESVMKVARFAEDLGIGTIDVSASTLPGPKGNVEYFLWLGSEGKPLDEAKVENVVTNGPDRQI